MMRIMVAAVALSTLAGCVQAEPRDEGDERKSPRVDREAYPEMWVEEREPAMAPDFPGPGATYPVLLFHMHHVPSARQRDEAAKEPRAFCFLDGVPVEPVRSTLPAMETCMGSPADPPTGRLFIDKSSYLGQGGRGALVMMDMCNGGVLVFSESASAFEVQAPAHRFRVQQLPDGTFAVDGSWIAPGTALKVGYYLHHGDKRDEEYVRVVFEAPGRWPLARMGVSGADLIGLPPRPTQGSGLVVDVPVAPAELREPLALVLDATPGRVQGITAMRAVHDGERLTELTMRVLTSDGAFTWYGAGREGDSLRLLGAFAPAPGVEPRVAAPRVLDIAALPWDTLRAGVEGGPLDVRLDPSARWAMTGNLSLGSGDAIPLGTCDAGCVFVRQGDAWERVILPERSEAAGAATLRVFLQEDASVWWHAP